MTKIDMDAYVRLGVQRPVFDAWLHDVGLVGESLIRIDFGEGVHRCTGHVKKPDGRFELKETTEVVDGTSTVRREVVLRTFDWFGPLPPVSVLNRLREIA